MPSVSLSSNRSTGTLTMPAQFLRTAFHTRYGLKERGDPMPNGLEITKAALDDFKKIQEYKTL